VKFFDTSIAEGLAELVYYRSYYKTPAVSEILRTRQDRAFIWRKQSTRPEAGGPFSGLAAEAATYNSINTSPCEEQSTDVLVGSFSTSPPIVSGARCPLRPVNDRICMAA
jgi:hypothetical protein